MPDSAMLIIVGRVGVLAGVLGASLILKSRIADDALKTAGTNLSTLHTTVTQLKSEVTA